MHLLLSHLYSIFFPFLSFLFLSFTKNFDILNFSCIDNEKGCSIELCKFILLFGVVVVHNLLLKYKNLLFIHNPEFLTARTAFEDFHNQTHIVLGKNENINDIQLKTLTNFYSFLYPFAEISICSSLESESMKIFCNCFYSVKIQFFTEIYLLCKKNNCDYNVVKNMMIKNNWINKMHTNIPGPDGNISYGGLCFPKDTNALLKYMQKLNTPHNVLQCSIEERNSMRFDKENCL